MILWGKVILMKIIVILIVLVLLVIAGLYAHTLFYGRSKIWHQIFKELQMAPDAQVADLGLNYAGLFVLIAKQLTAPGKVMGVNIGPEAIAKRERGRIVENRVADRAQIVNGDLLNLPLSSRSFDYVLSSFAFHGVKPAINRGRAIQEAGRILKPDGQLIIVDFGSLDEYATLLHNIGFQNVRVVSTGWIGWWGGPWLPTKALVASRK